jgi:hypothetical protein
MKTEGEEKEGNKSSTMNLIDDYGCSVQGSIETYRSSMIFAFSLTFIHRVCQKKMMEIYSIYIFDEIISNRGYCEFSVLIISTALVIFVFVYLFMIGAFAHSLERQIWKFSRNGKYFYFNITLTK